MNRQLYPKELELIEKIERAFEKHKKPERRAESREEFYFAPECVPVFQELAREVAIIIADQGVEDTCGPILAVAAEIKKLDDIEWNHPRSIGRAFERGLGADVILTNRANPLADVKLPPKGPVV